MVAEDGEEIRAVVLVDIPKNSWGFREALGKSQDDDA